MSKAYIFYNPLAGNGRCKEDVSMLECVLPDEIVYSIFRFLLPCSSLRTGSGLQTVPMIICQLAMQQWL